MTDSLAVIDSLKAVIEQQRDSAPGITIVDVGLLVLVAVVLLELALWGIRLLRRRQDEVVNEQREAIEVGDVINRRLRERVADVEEDASRAAAKSAEHMKSLEEEIASTKGALVTTTGQYEETVRISGSAIIAASFGLKYGSDKLKELTDEQAELLKAMPASFGKVLGTALPRLYDANTLSEKKAALLTATDEIGEVYSDALLAMCVSGIKARWLAARLASFVPLAVRDAFHEVGDDSSEGLLHRIDQQLNSDAPLTGFGKLSWGLLGEEVESEGHQSQKGT